MKFKVGDRVKRIDRDNSVFLVGDTGEVVGHNKFYDVGVSVKMDKNGKIEEYNNINNLELIPNSNSELDQLLETAEAGRQAAKRLAEKFTTEIEYDQLTVNVVTSGNGWGMLHGFRKISKPKFEPRKIGGLEVSLEVDTLKVGCQSFPLIGLKAALNGLVSGTRYSVEFTDYKQSEINHGRTLYATRNGASCAGHTMLWADVEKLYEAIKELA